VIESSQFQAVFSNDLFFGSKTPRPLKKVEKWKKGLDNEMLVMRGGASVNHLLDARVYNHICLFRV
jgi:hypothetical protein